MSQRRTLGGERLGSGNRNKVDTKTFNRSTHDLGYVMRTTMSAGTLVPFMCEVALPGDNFEINLGCEVLTLPTVGPLFGSMKVQLDVFLAPVRLYQAMLHNNKLGVGMNMSAVKLPYFELEAPYMTEEQVDSNLDLDNSQINPSSILSYLGIRGIGIPKSPTQRKRRFNAIPLLAYWDIFKNYYANKMEENAWVIHTGLDTFPRTVTAVRATTGSGPLPINEYPDENPAVDLGANRDWEIISTTTINPDTILIGLQRVGHTSGIDRWIPFSDLFTITGQTSTLVSGTYNYAVYGDEVARSWRYKEVTDITENGIQLSSFPLSNIDEMREYLLDNANSTAPKDIMESALQPYTLLKEETNAGRSIMGSQEGLAVKTYQSDLFNNWLNTEYIDGINGIAAVTAVSTVGDEFTIDSLILHKKVYDMLNDVLVSGGTYDDWQEVVYDHVGITRAGTPIYYGSLIKELQFQEVVSNAEATGEAGSQPLGTLAGRGRLGQKHKGGSIDVKVDEISFLIGIASITPRIDYSQGNDWYVNLESMDDFHKPHLDEIGFQELITDQMAWWDTSIDVSGNLVTKSAGKQPAWLNYMTNVNKIKGNFAVPNDSMFMVLSRRYSGEFDAEGYRIGDLTTYIDPRHFNHIFAQTTLDSQNYWVQFGVDIKARRKISARVMPNL